MLRAVAPLLVLLAACGDDTLENVLPVPPETVRLSVYPLPEGGVIHLDGATGEDAWARAPRTVIKLEGPGPNRVYLQAAYDEKRIYLLVQWQDDDKSENYVWRFTEGLQWQRREGEDAFSIFWAPGSLYDHYEAHPADFFVHGDQPAIPAARGVMDVWYWGAQSTPLGKAEDRVLPYLERKLREDGATHGSGTWANENNQFVGPRFVPVRIKKNRNANARFLMYDNAQALTKEKWDRLDKKSNIGWEVSRFVLRPVLGSRADVDGKARFVGNAWILELARDLKTGNPDDLPLDDPLIPYLFAVGVHDGTAGAARAHGSAGAAPRAPRSALRSRPARAGA